MFVQNSSLLQRRGGFMYENIQLMPMTLFLKIFLQKDACPKIFGKQFFVELASYFACNSKLILPQIHHLAMVGHICY